ncbi:MAG: hypothetical protein KAT70_02695 [Thermoplasmata archaeon]|nr:hypothetical protein [Thermoplasmata archaeon]
MTEPGRTPIEKDEKSGWLFNGRHYDSKEEIYFRWYVVELFRAGYVKDVEYQPKGYILAPPQHYEVIHVSAIRKNRTVQTRSLLMKHSYQPDFRIVWESKAYGRLVHDLAERVVLDLPFISQEGASIIEVKPKFDQHNMTREFTINQKWIFHQYGMYIQPIHLVPDFAKGGKKIRAHKNALFEVTFCPRRYRRTDGSKNMVRKGALRYKTFEDWEQGIKAGEGVMTDDDQG